jgi:hypothetical protein
MTRVLDESVRKLDRRRDLRRGHGRRQAWVGQVADLLILERTDEAGPGATPGQAFVVGGVVVLVQGKPFRLECAPGGESLRQSATGKKTARRTSPKQESNRYNDREGMDLGQLT